MPGGGGKAVQDLWRGSPIYSEEGQPATLSTSCVIGLHLNSHAVVMQAAVKATMQLRKGMAGGLDVSMSLLFYLDQFKT
jgi:hypothetical protein